MHSHTRRQAHTHTHTHTYIYIYIYIYIVLFDPVKSDYRTIISLGKKQNRSYWDYKFISIFLCVFDKIKKHEKKFNRTKKNLTGLLQILWIGSEEVILNFFSCFLILSKIHNRMEINL